MHRAKFRRAFCRFLPSAYKKRKEFHPAGHDCLFGGKGNKMAFRCSKQNEILSPSLALFIKQSSLSESSIGSHLLRTLRWHIFRDTRNPFPHFFISFSLVLALSAMVTFPFINIWFHFLPPEPFEGLEKVNIWASPSRSVEWGRRVNLPCFFMKF